MTKVKKLFAQLLAFLMVITIAAASLDLSAFALSDSDNDSGEQTPVQYTDGDSQFVLANPDDYMPDDYYPEKIYEEEKANYALKLVHEKLSC